MQEASLQVKRTQQLLQELQKPITNPVKFLAKHGTSHVRIKKLSQRDVKKLYNTVISKGGAKPIVGGVHSKIIECETFNDKEFK